MMTLTKKHKSMKKIIIAILLSSFLCTTSAQEVKIAAAADLRYALDEVITAYKKANPKANIKVTYGSSGNAYHQILNGAPYDIFFSADILYPQKLHEKGMTWSPPTLYAIGYIVLWSKQIDVSMGINALKDPRIKKIAIANPEHAPYGKRAQESLTHYQLLSTLKDKLIFGENISQAAQYTQTGNAEIGILALSLVLSSAMKNQGNYFIIDSKSYTPLEQGFAIIKKNKVNADAVKFAKYIESVEAKKILQSFGFTTPNR